MSLAEQIAVALGGAKKTPAGYVCKCPIHDDQSASLSIKEKDDGSIVVNCLAGCDWLNIKQYLEQHGILGRKNFPARSSKPRSNRYEGAKFYEYRDPVGNLLCRKVKLPNKKMWFERYDGREWKMGLEGMTVPLYNLAAVLAADTVYLCEGEKDAESLISAGLVGTTNHAGAKSWASHLTEQLKGKTIIVIPDNDDAGRKRVAMIAKAVQSTIKELRVFIPEGVPEHGDVTDWITAGGNAADIFKLSVVIEKAKERKKATREEFYTELFDVVLNNPRRCMFAEKLMSYDAASGLWNPAVNMLDIIKSEALVLNEQREAKFTISSIQPHFFAYEASKPMEFLVDIDEWDGEDRISAMASLVKLKASAGVSAESFADLLLEWCSKVFERKDDPMIQNRILVLQGGQEIGKDTWTEMLLGGLGQFLISLSIVKEDKDTFLALHRGLVMKISEFDKTAKAEVSTLKDIITTPNTHLRAPYDKDARLRLSRCSFISSANAENLLRDPTGNRRFMIVEVDRIEWAYAGWSRERIREWQMQCLAQMVHLSELKYRASVEAWTEMKDYIQKHTPSDPSLDMAEEFIRKIRAKNVFYGTQAFDILPTDALAVEVITDMSRQSGIRPRGVKTLINNRIGVFKRNGDKRYWIWKVPEVEAPDINILELPEQEGLNI